MFPGQDEVVRVAKVQTFHGYLVRPVAKLVMIVLDKGHENCISNGVPIRGRECAINYCEILIIVAFENMTKNLKQNKSLL
jgi:hypothetical protein